jgi:periplasmic divalent cation tolerance protein
MRGSRSTGPASVCGVDQIVVVTTTVDDRAVAERLSANAVAARLAACAQIAGPIISTYHWRGDVESAAEHRIVFKTAADRADELVAHLVEAHPYEVPEVVVTPVTGGNPAYAAWVTAETRGSGA